MKMEKSAVQARMLHEKGGDITLNDVTKVFRSDVFKGPQTALERLSCQFAGGECTGLLGHNGAGKTTTIRLILGLLKPSRGSITMGGVRLSLGQKRFMGYMPEVNKLPGMLTAREVLSYQLRIFRPEFLAVESPKKVIDEALAAVSLEAHAGKRVGRMSKGMARRLAWAQATIHRPRVLILDEPASGLDPLARRQMIDWIQVEKARGTTIILCTHEMNQVRLLCDRYHVLKRGKLVASASVSESVDQAYALHVSGLSSDMLEKLAERENLPPWRSIKQKGALAELTFVGYEHSAMWAKSLFVHGYVVTHFGGNETALDDQVLKHFAGDV